MPDPKTTQPEPSLAAQRLRYELELIRARLGVGRMTTDRELARLVGVNVREVVDLAGELLTAGHLVIASCDVRNPGRCLLFPQDDLRLLQVYIDSLSTRAKKILNRRKHLRKARATAERKRQVGTDGQLSLELEVTP